jgi:hypothetical protein
MKILEKLSKEAHREWVERFAAPLAGRPMDETEKRSLGRVPFEAAFEAGFRAAREMASACLTKGPPGMGVYVPHEDARRAIRHLGEGEA